MSRPILCGRYIAIAASDVRARETMVKISVVQVSGESDEGEEVELVAGEANNQRFRTFKALFTQPETDFKIKVANDSGKVIR